MKIGFLFRNSKLASVDARHPELGNPGMGGRPYMNLLAAYHLAKLGQSRVQPVLFCEREAAVPECLDAIICGDIFGALEAAGEKEIDYFVVDASGSDDAVKAIISFAERKNQKLIVWLSLLPPSKSLHRLDASPMVSAVVCVEHQMLELMRDHPVVRKTTVITNGIPLAPYQLPPLRADERDPAVTYIGSLVPQKGFGRLARAWPDVLRAVPQAKLSVIGTGALYGRDKTLGNWGVADEKFEAKHIRPFLSDATGEPLPSVNFLGILGHEKDDILRRSTIGIANPVGNTETFCICAVEIQAAGTPVIAGAKYGLFDTVNHGETGYLVRSTDELVARIIELLRDDALVERMGNAGYRFVTERYDFEKIAHVWLDLFVALADKIGVKTPPPKPRPVGLGAAIARYNSILRRMIGSPTWWPSYLGVAGGYDKMNKYIRTGHLSIFKAARALRRSS